MVKENDILEDQGQEVEAEQEEPDKNEETAADQDGADEDLSEQDIIDADADDDALGQEMQQEESADTQSEESGDKPEAKESRKLFKGKDKAEKKKDKNKERISELEDQVKRQMAEFDNFRKRTEKEKAQMFEVGAKSVIEKILPVVDNFERGLSTTPEDESSKAFVDGMQMIYKQLMTELETIGVTPIEAEGKEFNPDYHNAVMQVASEELESGMVAQELQKGYMYRDSVVRHSMVSVVE